MKDIQCFIKNHKQMIMCLIVMAVVCASTFAADNSQLQNDLGNTINNIVGVFNSGWVKGIACLAFVAEIIGMFWAGSQSQGAFKKFIIPIAATILFLNAGRIINLVFGAENTSIEEQLQSGSN